MLKLHYYSDRERLTALWAALNRVLIPHRHIHRQWEYPWALQELQPLVPGDSMMCIGAMWDTLGLYLADRQDRFIAIDTVAVPSLACWYGAPAPQGCELLSGPAEDVIPKYWADPIHPTNRIDSIFCISTLEHVLPAENRNRLWREMCRVAARRVVVTVDYTIERDRDDILDKESLAEMVSGQPYDQVIGQPQPLGGWAPVGLVWTRE